LNDKECQPNYQDDVMLNQDLKPAAILNRNSQSKAPRNLYSSLLRALDPTFLLAAVCTGVFYSIVLQPFMHGTVLYNYTTEHAVEYVIVALFIWGIIDIVFKCAAFPNEFRSLQQEWLPPFQGREPIKNAAVLLHRLKSLPRWKQQSRLGRCLIAMLEFVVEKETAKDCRDYYRTLSELEEDRLHSAYTLLRFVIAVTPILGFLGTVVHFGTALSGMSFDEMTAQLPVVVAEMGMAFNTTTVALGAAMTVMSLMFLCDRVDRGILHNVDRYIEREVITRFEIKEQNVEPFLEIIRSAHEEALSGIAVTLQQQFEMWGNKTDSLLQRFDTHQEHASQGWFNALSILQQQHESATLASEKRLTESLNVIDTAETNHLIMIQGILERATSFREDISKLTSTLETIARGEGKLLGLQESLAENLRTLRQLGQFDEALHGLTAAVHLLTVRHHSSAV
jgi:biopolymer transport protein ExbB/TolQ